MKFIKRFLVETIIIISTLLFVLSIVLYFKNFGGNKGVEKISNWADFGSYLSGVASTIISFCSLMLIYITYKNQAKNSSVQQFETTFFNLLSTQRNILSSLSGFLNKELNSENPFNDLINKIGGEYISSIAEKINYDINSFPAKINEANTNIFVEINQIYINIYRGKEPQLGHYFRHLYHLIKFVNESNIESKKKYTDIIQAQMSDDELYVTFYNGISEFGSLKFKPLLDDYSFLENIRSRGDKFKLHCNMFYPNTTFK
jgi:Putative phage abortive infection protein